MVRKYIALLGTVMVLLAHGVIYPATAVITSVDYETDVVTVQRSTGFVYTFEGVEDLTVGDVMSLLMYSNGTPDTIADDVVISARYSGFVSSDLLAPTEFWQTPEM